MEGQQVGSHPFKELILTQKWSKIIDCSSLLDWLEAKIQPSVGSYCKVRPPTVLQIQHVVDFADIKGKHRTFPNIEGGNRALQPKQKTAPVESILR